MDLLIGEIGKYKLDEFAKYANGTIRYTPSTVTISSMHLSIVFSQPEQFSRLINCEFWFSVDVSFFYEDIHEAILMSSGTDTDLQSQSLQSLNEMERNDNYIANVVKFSTAHWEAIIEVPPRWYEKAVEITNEKLRPIFPHIADEDFRNKVKLLESWRSKEEH